MRGLQAGCERHSNFTESLNAEQLREIRTAHGRTAICRQLPDVPMPRIANPTSTAYGARVLTILQLFAFAQAKRGALSCQRENF